MDKIQETQIHVNETKKSLNSASPASEMPIMFSLHDVTVAYKQGEGHIQKVLNEIHLQFASGEAVAIVGGNGSGKSTLLRVLAGLTPTSRGTVVRAEMPVVPIVFQNPDAQFVGETVYEDICFGLENIAVPREQMPERVARALAEVGLAGYEQRSVEQLSGGQKQLVCIAAALALESSVLLLDEPTAMLDPLAKEQVLSVLQRQKRLGTTIIWATQAMDEAGFADRIIALADGQVKFDDAPEVFFYDRSDGKSDGKRQVPCERLGFRLPYAIQLFHQLHNRGILTDQRPVRTEACLEAVSEICR